MADTLKREDAPTVKAQELLELLSKHFDVDPKKHRLRLNFRFAAGDVGPNPDQVLPGLVLGLAEVQLMPRQAATTKKPTNKKVAGRSQF